MSAASSATSASSKRPLPLVSICSNACRASCCRLFSRSFYGGHTHTHAYIDMLLVVYAHSSSVMILSRRDSDSFIGRGKSLMVLSGTHRLASLDRVVRLHCPFEHNCARLLGRAWMPHTIGAICTTINDTVRWSYCEQMTYDDDRVVNQ